MEMFFIFIFLNHSKKKYGYTDSFSENERTTELWS